MAILSIFTDVTGQIGVNPRNVKIVTTDSLATVTTAGYLNNAQRQGYTFYPSDKFEIYYGVSAGVGTYAEFLPTFANQNNQITLSLFSNGASGGNVNAGSNGVAGQFVSWPAVANEGTLNLAAVSNASGNFSTTISNAAAIGQSQVISIPDSGAATASFVLTKSAAASQTISSGNLIVSGGNLQAGASGAAGTLISFPGTAANGSLIIAGVNAGGAFNTTISNGTMGQSTVYTMGDIGAATGGLVVATSAIRMKSVAQAAVAGGAAAQTVTDTFCTTGSMVVACWNDTTNAVQIQKVAAGNGSFVVTSTADPGASHINYIITK